MHSPHHYPTTIPPQLFHNNSTIDTAAERVIFKQVLHISEKNRTFAGSTEDVRTFRYGRLHAINGSAKTIT